MAGKSAQPTEHLIDMIATRRAVLAAGMGGAAASLFRASSVWAQDEEDSDDSGGLNWIDVFGQMLIAAAEEFGGLTRSGVILYQSIDAIVAAQIISAESAAAFPSFQDAFYIQYLVPDPDNASGATFSTNIGVTIIQAASTDDAKAIREALQSSWASRPDARKLTADETGAEGLTAYLIESTYAAAGGNVPANYVNGVSIFGRLVVFINGVAYDTDPINALGALAREARSLLRRADTEGATLGRITVPNGQPEASLFVIVHNGQRIERFEEPEESREITNQIGDVERVETYYRLQMVAQPETEGAPPVMFVQNYWVWRNEEDAEAFAARFHEIFEEIDPKQNVERVYVSPEDAEVVSAGTVRALRKFATNNQTDDPFLALLIEYAFFLWLIGEGSVGRGIEGYWSQRFEFWSFGMVLLDLAGGDEDLEEWVEEGIADGLPGRIKDWIEEDTGVDPDEDPSIVSEISSEDWAEYWDDYLD